jgi:hypothetical protein
VIENAAEADDVPAKPTVRASTTRLASRDDLLRMFMASTLSGRCGWSGR